MNILKQNAANHQQAKFRILLDIYGYRTGGFLRVWPRSCIQQRRF